MWLYNIQYTWNMQPWAVSYREILFLAVQDVCWFNSLSTEGYNATVVMLSVAEIQNWIHSFIIYEPLVDSMAAHKQEWLSCQDEMTFWKQLYF